MKKMLGLFNPHYVKDHIYSILRQVGNQHKIAKIAIKDGHTKGKYNIALMMNEKDVSKLLNEVTTLHHKLAENRAE